MDDGLPSVVCCKCRHQLEKFWKFRIMAQRSESLLKEYLMSTIRKTEQADLKVKTKKKKKQTTIRETTKCFWKTLMIL